MTPRIIALGGGGFSGDPYDERGRRLDQVILDATGTARPRLCFIGTASGDAEAYALRFHRAFAGRAEVDELNLFTRPRHPALREFVLGFDALYVGGGSTLNLMAIWRAHGLDRILAEAWQGGVVLGGMSAGMICWFETAVTDSYGDGLRPIDGLGLLPGSACAHGSDLPRRTAYAGLVAAGVAPGYSADDGVALVFEGTRLVEAVTADPSGGAMAYRVTRDGPEALPVRQLG